MKKYFLFGLILLLTYLYQSYHLSDILTLEYLQQNQTLLKDTVKQNLIQSLVLYFFSYVFMTAFSIPGAAVFTLLGGAVFGFTHGFIMISFASSIGATLAFIMSRYFFRDWVEEKFPKAVTSINSGINKEGVFYLFSLRLIPLFPFFLINLCMGLTRISVFRFYIISQVGMLAGTAVYVNAGVQLSQIESLSSILSTQLLLSLALLGLLPLMSKKLISVIQTKKVYSTYKKPKNFDYNMIVIGAGSAGLVTSYISAAIKSKVLLIEKEKMGGDCLNTGCVPSKALLHVAHTLKNSYKLEAYGVQISAKNLDFQKIMNHVHKTIKKIEPHDSVQRYQQLGVSCLNGSARIISPYQVQVGDQVYTTQNITIATGASPFIPSIKGLKEASPLTSLNLWSLETLPKKLVILGAGAIGVEMAQAFNSFGSKVTLVEMQQQILPKEDRDITDQLYHKLTSEGIDIKLNHQVTEVKDQSVICENGDTFEFNQILCALGRKANTKNFGLEELKIELNPNGTIQVNEYLQTKYPNIFACGDVAGPYQLTHMASHQAWYCAVNAHFGFVKKFKVDYSTVPWVTYTSPQVATVGLNENALKQKEMDYEVIRYDLADLDRAICEDKDYGVIKVLMHPKKDRILGVSIVADYAGEMISEFVTTMKHGKGLNDILSTIHSYPTFSEANKFSAGVWKKKHAPQKVLKLLEKFFNWQRG